jgi:hypothetical protein
MEPPVMDKKLYIFAIWQNCTKKAEERPLKDILFGCIVDVAHRRETHGRIAEAEIPKLKLLRAAASSSKNDALRPLSALYSQQTLRYISLARASGG